MADDRPPSPPTWVEHTVDGIRLTMQRTFLKAKIHRARVTQADLDYVGSVTIDSDLIQTAGLLPYEQVDIYDITNGNRLSTYVISGPAGSGVIGINGAAAKLVHQGDLVIIASYCQLDSREIADHEVTTLLVDQENRVAQILRGRVMDPASTCP